MIGLTAMVNLLTAPLLALDFLFAGAEELITVVIFLVVGIISAISQYLNKKKEAAARQRRLEQQAQREAEGVETPLREPEPPRRLAEPQRPAKPQRPAFGRQPQRPQARPAAAPVDGDVAAEIRDFLERAATGKPAGQVPAAPKPVVATAKQEAHRPLADRPAHHSSLERRPLPTSHSTQRPVEAKVIPQRKPFTNQDRRREEARQAQKQAEAKHRQAEAARTQAAKKQSSGSKFDHKLGSLEKQTRHQPAKSAATLSSEAMAADVAAMFADTENIRHAIVINEILTRPTHRWE